MTITIHEHDHDVFDRYIVDEKTAHAVVAAARDSLAIDRAYRGALASAMLEIPE